MTRRVLIALLVCLLCVPFAARAQEPPPPEPPGSVDFVLDFEALPPGPLDPNGTDITLSMEGFGSLTLRLTRGMLPGDDPLEINGLGVPGFGAASLSTFNADPTDPNGIPLEIEIVATPPGTGVERIVFQMGDFLPSDIDDLWTSTLAGPGGAQVAGTIAITPDLYDEPLDPESPFRTTTVSRQRAQGIQSLQAQGGSFNFPGSVYYDNFVFTVSPTDDGTPLGNFAAGTDAPESSFGGDPRNDQLATNSGQGGAVVVYGVDSNSDALYTLDLETGDQTIIGRLGGADLTRFTTPVALAVRPSDGTIFVNNNSPAQDDGLCTVDPDTGLATLIGGAFIDGALAFDSSDNLYAADDAGALALIDQTTGDPTPIGGDPLPRLFGLDYNPADGLLYGITTILGTTTLLKIDPSTGNLVEGGSLPLIQPEPPLASDVPGTVLFDANGTLHGTVFDQLFEIDPDTAAVSNVRDIDTTPQGLGLGTGVASLPPSLPTPPSIVLLLNGQVFDPPGGVGWVNGKLLSFVASASDPNPADVVTITGTLNNVNLPETGPGATLGAQAGSNPAERLFAWTPEGEVGPHNLTFTATSAGDVASISITVLFPAEGEGGDSDGDGLLDVWETDGYDFELNGETVHVDLPGLGADPDVKDVFIVVDYMVGTAANQDGDDMVFDHRPQEAALQLVKDAFAPPVGDPRAGRHEDIALHILVRHKVDETGAIIPDANGNPQPRIDFAAQLGAISGGTYVWTAPPGATIPYFDDIKAAYFAQELRPAMHYAIFAHKIGGTYSGMSRGSPESDFIVSLGDILDARSVAQGLAAGSTVVPTKWEQAGTLMHEGGHNLGLFHGGDENVLSKPNYLSVMNLPFQLQGLRVNGQDGFFDFSFVKLEDLDETALDESAGLSAPLDPGTGLPVADISDYGTTWFFRPGEIAGDQQWTSAAGGSVNWMVDSLADPPGPDTIEAAVATDINRSGHQTTLTGFNDWANLKFLGGVMGTGVALPRPATSPAEEITVTVATSLRPAPVSELRVHRSNKQETL
ncbi:MAG: NHL repeat-containing protein, partial [Planctomycetota bacterium]